MNTLRAKIIWIDEVTCEVALKSMCGKHSGIFHYSYFYKKGVLSGKEHSVPSERVKSLISSLSEGAEVLHYFDEENTHRIEVNPLNFGNYI